MDLYSLVRVAEKLSPFVDGRHKHVAFLIKGGSIVSIGINKRKTNPKNLKYPYQTPPEFAMVHAELDAILTYWNRTFFQRKSNRRIEQAFHDLSDFTLVVMRIRRNSMLGLSKPCQGCQQLISQFGIRKVYYSVDQDKILGRRDQYDGLFKKL